MTIDQLKKYEDKQRREYKDSGTRTLLDIFLDQIPGKIRKELNWLSTETACCHTAVIEGLTAEGRDLKEAYRELYNVNASTELDVYRAYIMEFCRDMGTDETPAEVIFGFIKDGLHSEIFKEGLFNEN